MQYLIQSHNRSVFDKTLDKLFRKRHEVFIGELGWDIPSKDGLEMDDYDVDEAVYMVSHDADNGVVGGVRLLPTTGSNMIKDKFSHHVADKSLIPDDPRIWEATRFFYRNEGSKSSGRGFARKGTLELFIGIIEFGVTWGLTGLLILTDLRIEKMLRNIGWNLKRISSPVEFNGQKYVIGVLPISKQLLKSVRVKTRINYPVLMAPLPLCPEQLEKVDLGITSTQDLIFADEYNLPEKSFCLESTPVQKN